MMSLPITIFANDRRVDVEDVWVDPWVTRSPIGDYRLLELEINDNDVVALLLGLELPDDFQSGLVLAVADSVSPNLLPAILQWTEGARLTLTISDEDAIRKIHQWRSAQL